MKKIFLSLMLLLSSSVFAQQDGAIGLIIYPVRQQERKSARWTLADWMDTKKKIAEQNAWLAAHTNKFPVDLSYGFDAGERLRGHEIDIGLFRFGFHARFENVHTWLSDSATSDGINLRGGEIGPKLRLFGSNPQDTLLSVFANYRYDQILSPTVPTFNANGWTAGAELQIYFANWLGIRGNWQKGFEMAPENATEPTLIGDSYSAAAFIEMGLLRIEYGYRNRDFSIEGTGISSVEQSDSEQFARLRLFL